MYDNITDDDDSSDTLSLFSLFIHDLWTDELVFEYTGRPMFADDAYENARLALLMYNAECNYENNKKGFFGYMSKHNCLYLLSDTLEFLKDKEMVKGGQYGNKAHPYSENVWTDCGYKKWSDIKIGDNLFGTNGNKTKVIDIPFDDISDIYKITLKDGRSVMASENHLWDVIDWNGLNKTLSTKQILKNYFRNKGVYKEYKYYIPKNNGVEFDKKELPMNPYLLGLILGDGCFSISKWHNIHYTSRIDDMKFYMKYLNLEYITVDDRHHWIRYKNCSKIFKELDLHDKTGINKFIPDIYKYSDRNSRLEIIRGLMDSDGHIGYGGNPEFTNTSLNLVDGIISIARSLGINCNKTVAKEPGAHNKKAWKARFYTNERLFNLERKYSRQKITKTRAFKTAIVNIEYIGREKSKCVTVDADDSCYLINDFITTHNSKGTGNYGSIAPYGRRCYRDYLLRSTPQINLKEVDGQTVEEIINVFNYQKLWSKGLLQETAMWTPDGNYDRHDAIIMLMLLREDKLRLLGDTSPRDAGQNRDVGYLGKDAFFEKNYRKDISTGSKLKF